MRVRGAWWWWWWCCVVAVRSGAWFCVVVRGGAWWCDGGACGGAWWCVRGCVGGDVMVSFILRENLLNTVSRLGDNHPMRSSSQPSATNDSCAFLPLHALCLLLREVTQDTHAVRTPSMPPSRSCLFSAEASFSSTLSFVIAACEAASSLSAGCNLTTSLLSCADFSSIEELSFSSSANLFSFLAQLSANSLSQYAFRLARRRLIFQPHAHVADQSLSPRQKQGGRHRG